MLVACLPVVCVRQGGLLRRGLDKTGPCCLQCLPLGCQHVRGVQLKPICACAATSSAPGLCPVFLHGSPAGSLQRQALVSMPAPAGWVAVSAVQQSSSLSEPRISPSSTTCLGGGTSITETSTRPPEAVRRTARWGLLRACSSCSSYHLVLTASIPIRRAVVPSASALLCCSCTQPAYRTAPEERRAAQPGHVPACGPASCRWPAGQPARPRAGR